MGLATNSLLSHFISIYRVFKRIMFVCRDCLNHRLKSAHMLTSCRNNLVCHNHPFIRSPYSKVGSFEIAKIKIAKIYGRLWLIRSVLRASKLSVLKLIEIVIMWVYYAIPFDFSLFLHFWTNIFNF